ncbi:hypothetical protein [uncultured Stenotrophomonas sp.]|uniref:hypothetical protein n=1 Tax=uncultured Stenotrophomonas sp. TaxID=165438 RepID=UPI0025ED1590|nr:hypothetical protein [uncultured Stenotrophomonas sp.]
MTAQKKKYRKNKNQRRHRSSVSLRNSNVMRTNRRPIFGYAGLFQGIVYKKDEAGNPIESTGRIVAPFNNNLIVNNGLNLLRTGNYVAYCRIGTGTAEPANGNNQLVNQVGATNAAGANNNASGYNLTDKYLWKRFSRRFSAGTISGKNLNEVAMAPAATGGIFCRALLKDGMGVPITIVLLDDEVLDIVYELRMYLPPVDTVVNAVIDGVDSVVTMRRTDNTANLNFWATILEGPLEPNLSYQPNTRYGLMLTALPAASTAFYGGMSGLAGPTITVAPYVADSCQTLVALNFGLTVGNVSPAAAFYMAGSDATDGRWTSPYGFWCYGFAPALNKTATRIAQVNVGVSWGRYVPEPTP